MNNNYIFQYKEMVFKLCEKLKETLKDKTETAKIKSKFFVVFK